MEDGRADGAGVRLMPHSGTAAAGIVRARHEPSSVALASIVCSLDRVDEGVPSKEDRRSFLRRVGMARPDQAAGDADRGRRRRAETTAAVAAGEGFP